MTISEKRRAERAKANAEQEAEYARIKAKWMVWAASPPGTPFADVTPPPRLPGEE